MNEAHAKQRLLKRMKRLLTCKQSSFMAIGRWEGENMVAELKDIGVTYATCSRVVRSFESNHQEIHRIAIP